MGGAVPAGFSGTKRNVYENGAGDPADAPLPRRRAGSIELHLIFDNARFGALLLPDIKTIYQNLLLGERLLLESVERYGAEAFLGAIATLATFRPRRCARRSAEVPDGVYEGEDRIDADGVDDSDRISA